MPEWCEARSGRVSESRELSEELFDGGGDNSCGARFDSGAVERGGELSLAQADSSFNTESNVDVAERCDLSDFDLDFDFDAATG